MTTSVDYFIQTYGAQPEQRVANAAAALARGDAVLLVDDAGRENEADIICAADNITVEQMALMIRHGSGIVCLCLTPAWVDRLALPLMVRDNTSRYGTGFTVSIEAREGVSTGVSAQDRWHTIKTATAADAKPEDLSRPGHVFPLRSAVGGVLARGGHTEGSIELARLAGLRPMAVLCELMNDDGTMATGSEIQRFAERFQLPVLTIADLQVTLRSAAVGETGLRNTA